MFSSGCLLIQQIRPFCKKPLNGSDTVQRTARVPVPPISCRIKKERGIGECYVSACSLAYTFSRTMGSMRIIQTRKLL